MNAGAGARSEAQARWVYWRLPSPEAPCELLEWDSRHFQLSIGRVTSSGLSSCSTRAIEEWRDAHNVDCLYLLAPVDGLPSVRLAEDLGFRLIDLRVTLARCLDGAPPRLPHGIRRFRDGDLPALKAMAGSLHQDSRFCIDPHFPPAQSRKLFEIWIENACTDPMHDVLVAERNRRPVGYVAIERRNSHGGRIQLIGVEQSLHRRGIGGDLVAAASDHLAAAHASHVEVVTQGRNLAALRLYQKHGFVTAAQELWYHWWRPAQRPAHGGVTPGSW